VTLTRPFGALPAALALPSFTIASPRALRRYRADDGVVDANGNFIAHGSYGIDHPTGTGPFRLESWTPGEEVVLVRNASYWGHEARMPRLVFRQLDDPRERLDALHEGTVDIEDLYKQSAVDAVQGPGLRVVWRPPFDVGYLGINQVYAPLRSPLVREALAYGLDRAAVLRRSYGTGATISREFTPPTLAGYSAAVPRYPYDPGRSRALLRKAGLRPPARVELWYPTGVWRPYLPDPPAVARGLAASLDRAGFRVLLRPLPWLPDYVRRVRGGGAELFLLGWIGDYADAGAFLEPIFGDTSTRFGFRSPSLQRMLARAQAEPDPAQRAALYRRTNREIMRQLPGVPLATTPQPVGVQRTVRGYVPSPLGIESLAPVSRS
jgi:peptide/nickel transport system substrate-binding protein